MNEIVEKFKYLNEKSKYFQQLKDDEDFLFDEIVKISLEDIKEVQKSYEEQEKIKRLRYEVANLLLNQEFNKVSFEKLKNEINTDYETNILKSWKDFSILYVFFFNPIKKVVNQYLEDIGNYFIDKLDLRLKLKTTNFDGPQNFGNVGCWIALFNPKYQSQSEGIQYFINFYVNNNTYGTYEHQGKRDIDIKKYDAENIDDTIIEAIANDIREQVNIILEDKKEEEKSILNTSRQPLNQILYGPPGTGKTFNTINKALEIIFEKETDKSKKIIYTFQKNELEKTIEELEAILTEDTHSKDERDDLKTAFEYYKKEQGQIEFVTFHQSYGYEEFVEGIKAKTNENGLEYKIESGIFKKLCETANYKDYIVDDLTIDYESKVWKVSLGGTGDQELKKKCFSDNEIRIGWEDVNEVGNDKFDKLGSNNQSTIKSFIEDMNIGDFVISIYSQYEIDGIGIIEGDFEQDDYEHYNKLRKVKWLSKERKNLKLLNDNKAFVQKTVYEIKRFKPQDLLNIIGTNYKVENNNSSKNYVLIIDEINRGNISKIFGELITLIEPSKRIGADEEIKVKLPYSNDNFGVPQNLYIIGTMNTADRSIALMDTALRRRFDFTEMMPDLETLNELEYIEGINIKSLLKTINKRIEYLYDRDHTIGHAYFMSLKDKNGDEAKVELDNIFRNKIIPLLQEYFYDDWEKIQIVLGDHPEQFKKKDISKDFNQYQFIQSEKIKEEVVLGFDHPDIENDDVEYKINSKFEKEAYLKIYGEYPKLKIDDNEE